MWNFNDFQDWFCNTFKKANPLPWQEAMAALIQYITGIIPDNMTVSVAKDDVTSASLKGNGTPDNPFILDIKLNTADFSGPQGPQGPQGPTGAQGPAGQGINNISGLNFKNIDGATYSVSEGWHVFGDFVFSYGALGDITAEGYLTLPIKAGNGISIDVESDNQTLNISSESKHVYLCNTNESISEYLENVSFIVFSEEELSTIDDLKIYFARNNLYNKPYPASGYKKYGGGGGDSYPVVYVTYTNEGNLEANCWAGASSPYTFNINDIYLAELK